jgi:hypothetical protein
MGRAWLCALFLFGCGASAPPLRDAATDAEAPPPDRRLADVAAMGADTARTVDATRMVDDARMIDVAASVDVGAVTAGETAASVCDAFPPQDNAVRWIAACLASVRHAWLKPGTLRLEGTLTIPNGTEVRALSPGTTTLVLAARTEPLASMNYLSAMIVLGSQREPGEGARLSGVTLNNNNLVWTKATPDSPSATLLMNGEHASAEDLTIVGPQPVKTNYHVAGVAYASAEFGGMSVKNVRIAHHFYGVVFGWHGRKNPNRLEGSEIQHLKCDSITFIRYGEAVGNTIHETGYDCENGPIPGGGIYSLMNDEGALIRNNTIYDTCGHGIDIDRGANFVIDGNHVRDPGHTDGGRYPWCVSASAAFVLGLNDSVISNNEFLNETSVWTQDPNRVSTSRGGRVFSDVGGPRAVAFVLAAFSTPVASPAAFAEPYKTVFGLGLSMRNHIVDNTFRAFTREGTGVGFFTSRNSGYGWQNGWSDQTLNTFQGNRTIGSNIGSVRCGGNVYGRADCASGSGPACNDDDYQHPSLPFHKDDCSYY